MSVSTPTRDELAELYLAQLPYAPYPVQEEALLAYFTAEQGVLVCAPTGTGKTLIAEAALFEALHTGSVAYYTTPLIALTEQKFTEMQAAAVRWGFPADSVGLVTGNRRVNPQARVLVVVAEILLNRLLHPAEFDFANVSAVVMDEFHSFADPQRGIVWELSLGLLPKHTRLLLLSATVGNANEFRSWLDRHLDRKIELVQGAERRVPLNFYYVADELLNEFVTSLAEGDEATRRTPALIFCFNRDECWSVAEQLKGCSLLGEPTRSKLLAELAELDFTQGVGPKLKQLLQRGVGVHHAGLLPKYRRVVEDLFQRKLLAVALCTETLASGINLPARSVVLTSLVKGPAGKQKLIDASSAHQIFGRAGRPQFDKEGFVFVLAHEDDVRILRWKEKYDAIPENTKDPGLLKAKKALKKKRPTRRDNQAYWNEQQFEKLRNAPAGKLYSKGPLPWRLLAYMLRLSPEVDRVRALVRKRLMDEPRTVAALEHTEWMLRTLHAAGFVRLEPEPPVVDADAPALTPALLMERLNAPPNPNVAPIEAPPTYRAERAFPTPLLDRLLMFRSVNPLYGAFLVEQLANADRLERIQALESVLGVPGPLLKHVRVPRDMPPGPLTTEFLDAELIRRGLIPAPTDSNEEEPREDEWGEHWFPPSFAEKLRLLFDAYYPDVADVETQGVWIAGELIEFNGKFNNYVKSHDLTKQEGLIFRHLLRLILLCGEFADALPAASVEWREELKELAAFLTESCREVDPASTDEAIEKSHAADVVEGEAGPGSPIQ